MLTLRRITHEPAFSFFNVENRLNQFLEDTLGTWTPALQVKEEADGLHITTEIPGVKPDQVHVSVEGNTLTMKGAKADLTFERSFTVPAMVDASAIKAIYENGVLTVFLPKAEQAKPRQIAVEVAKS